MDFSLDKLKEKKGPLPLWAWIVLVAGVGYFGYSMLNRKPPTATAGEAGDTGPNGEFESSQSVTKVGEDGSQITSSYSARGQGTATGQMYYNAQQLQPQQGNVYVNLPGQQNPGDAPAQSPNYLGRENGFWFTLYRDMYPQEVAQQAYNLPDYQGKPDFVSLAYDAIAIMLANPGVKVPDGNIIPKGTKLFIPGSHGKTTGGSTWADFSEADKGYNPGPMVPAPQTTRETRVVA